MPALLIRHRVADYPAWRVVFDEERASRWSNGCRGGQVFRNSDESGELLILLEWDDPVRARLYSQSDELRDSMANAGVTDRPDVWLLEHTDDISN
jgi:hypothetical protein